MVVAIALVVAVALVVEADTAQELVAAVVEFVELVADVTVPEFVNGDVNNSIPEWAK